MIKLQEFKDNSINLNWQTILIGLVGPGKLPPQVTPKEAVSYAIDLVSRDSNQSDVVWALAGSNENDTTEIKNLVRELANKEKGLQEDELDKWKVIMLKKELTELKNDPIYDLIKLTEFWEMFNFPDDSPHVVQGMRNSIFPQDYYTKENYEKIIDNHRKWIERKISQLREA